jgi:Tfp pilus assembly protein PilF
MIADTPLTGIGLDMFQRVYPLYILPAYRNVHPHAHNLFLQTYLDAGPLGCAGMLLLAAAAVAAMVRLVRDPAAGPLQRTAGAGAAISWAAVFLHAQVDSYFAGDPRTYFVMFLPLGLLLGASPPVTWSWSRREALAGSMVASGLLLLATPWLLPALWSNVGSVERIRDGDAGAARASFERALALQPRSWVAERGLGLLGPAYWLRAAIQDGAPGQLVHVELAQALPPEAAPPEWRAAGAAPYLVRQALATADADEREQLLVTAIEVNPDEAEAHEQLAELDLSQARFAAARAVLQSGGHSGYAKLLLGLMDYWLDGNLQTATQRLREAIANSSEDDSLSRAIADMLRDAGQQNPAPESLPKVAAQARTNSAPDTLGRAYQALGLYAQAGAEFRRVADPIGHYDLAQLRLEEGEPVPALSQLREAVQAIPNQEDFRLALARLYLHIGSIDQAKQEYRVVLSLDPGNAEARRALA